MRLIRAFWIVALLLSTAAIAPAAPADVAGAWTMSYTTRDGTKMTSTLTLTREGEKWSGTISSPRGSVALDEVSVKNDEIAFAVIRVGFGDRIRIDYTGTVNVDTMKRQMKVGDREAINVTATRGGKA